MELVRQDILTSVSAYPDIRQLLLTLAPDEKWEGGPSRLVDQDETRPAPNRTESVHLVARPRICQGRKPSPHVTA